MSQPPDPPEADEIAQSSGESVKRMRYLIDEYREWSQHGSNLATEIREEAGPGDPPGGANKEPSTLPTVSEGKTGS
ncbi:MAG TPA: hypothetical protein VM120_20060 [Bryobacteraceae bacterium]|nr:hypothetical protein [Bryobacteraceae bacterium]